MTRYNPGKAVRPLLNRHAAANGWTLKRQLLQLVAFLDEEADRKPRLLESLDLFLVQQAQMEDELLDEILERDPDTVDDLTPEERDAELEALTERVVPGEAWTEESNLLCTADLDACSWLEQASEEEVLALAACDWGGACAVARWLVQQQPQQHPTLEHFLQMLEQRANKFMDPSLLRFECQLEPEPALDWLRRHRPGLYTRVIQHEEL